MPISRWATVLLPFCAFCADPVVDPNWKKRLGTDPAISAAIDQNLKSAASAVKSLPDPTQYPAKDDWQPRADSCSALVNVYRLSGDPSYLNQARAIGDWLIQSNDYLVANSDPSIPYLGWGPEVRQGYFKCTDQFSYHADDLWDTTAASRCLLKLSEVDPDGTASPYFQRAKQIADSWPYVDHSSGDGNPATPGLVNDGPYAAAGLRWYAKSNEPCENRYVKNTNIVMAEQLFRVYAQTQYPGDLDRAVRTMNTQLWDVLAHRNLAYTGYMTYLDQSDPEYVEQVQHNEAKIKHTDPGKPDDMMRCGVTDSSCWAHLSFEAFSLYNVKQLYPGAGDDASAAIQLTMTTYRTSAFGNTAQFDWSGSNSPTHITAYNCALRFSGDAVYLKECLSALQHYKKPDGTVFFSLVPDALVAAVTKKPGS